MLELKNIRKEYVTGETSTIALKNVSIKFRRNEFVSILGPSDCGKTTLLNIIGGLDRYDSGNLIINGKSTKEYKDKNWDTYRNHTIGFVFQSYNLIMHLTVAENVELALTLSGVSETERKQKTLEVLERVGLSDKAKVRPNQLSGGQMQRVAIARALINDPDILLADEPTGALDSTTGVQIMNLLKEIAKEKLVIMVTHNPELAEEYSTRLVRMMDGEILSDSNPVLEELEVVKEDEKVKKPSMSFWTSLKLSFKNMLTKKARTILVAFAGSIGIIGIALILSMSAGFQNYIDDIQEKTLSEYPLTIRSETTEMSFLMEIIKDVTSKPDEGRDQNKIYVNSILKDFINKKDESTTVNDLESFKHYLDNNEELPNLITDIKFSYRSNFYVYPGNGDPSIVYPLPSQTGANSMVSWVELIDNAGLLENKYELLKGSWPTKEDEIVLFVNSKGEITDIVLYMLGEITLSELLGTSTENELPVSYDLDYFIGQELKMLVDSDLYERLDTPENGILFEKVTNSNSTNSKLASIIEKKSTSLKVTGIVKPTGESPMEVSTYIGGIGYNTKLKNFVIEKNKNSDVIQTQLASTETNILTGQPFVTDANNTKTENYNRVLRSLGYANLDNPDNILIYPKSFNDKERIIEIINEYNEQATESKKISFTDEVGLMISSVSEIVDAVSYVLIAFVSVSLIVSSIMIAVITYISVLERTKEIGILRSIGASKTDISRVFNAETLIIGFTSGIMGVGISLLLLIPINIIIEHFTSVPNMGQLPLAGGIALIIISTVLTLIAGIVPSMIAAKKDPVVALRSE